MRIRLLTIGHHLHAAWTDAGLDRVVTGGSVSSPASTTVRGDAAPPTPCRSRPKGFPVRKRNGGAAPVTCLISARMNASWAM